MTSTPPESLEVVGARARARSKAWRAARGLPPECDAEEWAAQGAAAPVAEEHARAVVLYAWRRPPAVAIVSPLVVREPPPPGKYAPVSLGAAPLVTWEQTQANESAAEPWGAVLTRILALPVLLRGPDPMRHETTVPPIPELVAGADAAARRARMARLAATIGEARALLAGESPAVVKRAQEALGRVG